MNIQETDMKMLGEFILTILKPQFDRIDNQFEKIDQRFEKIDRRFEKIDRRFEKLDQRLDDLEANIKYEISRLDEKIDSTATLIIRNTIVDHSRINQLERQVKKINTKLGIE